MTVTDPGALTTPIIVRYWAYQIVRVRPTRSRVPGCPIVGMSDNWELWSAMVRSRVQWFAATKIERKARGRLCRWLPSDNRRE